MKKEELLKNVSLFSGLRDREIKSLAEFCMLRTFKKGDTLVKQGDSGIGLYIVKSGKVQIVKETSEGIRLGEIILGPGDFFGEIAVIDNAPRSASVIAVEQTECLILTSWVFKARMEAHPDIAICVLYEVVKRFRETNEELLNLSHA